MGKSKLIRTGMSLLGMVLSYTFGINFLGGLAGTMDNIGNIIVDVSEGIGFVSKAIDFVERFIDPPDPNEEKQLPEKLPLTPPTVDVPQPVLCKKGNCVPYDPSKDRVLQQKLIQIEREKILQGAVQQPPLSTTSSERPSTEATTTLPKDQVPQTTTPYYKGQKRGGPSPPKGKPPPPKAKRYVSNDEDDEEDD